MIWLLHFPYCQGIIGDSHYYALIFLNTPLYSLLLVNNNCSLLPTIHNYISLLLYTSVLLFFFSSVPLSFFIYLTASLLHCFLLIVITTSHLLLITPHYSSLLSLFITDNIHWKHGLQGWAHSEHTGRQEVGFTSSLTRAATAAQDDVQVIYCN